MTGRELVTASLRLLGAVAPGEAISASEADEGLAAINRMIDSWSNERLMTFTRVREEFSLVSGTQSYTMGSGGDFDTTRPQKIDDASIEVQSSTPSEHMMKIVTLEEWARIQIKDTSSDIPHYLYPEYGASLVTLQLYPKPSATNKVVLYSWKPLSAITLNGNLTFPPGYERALVYNGAQELAPEYGRPLSSNIVAIAADSKAALKRMNHVSRFLQIDLPYQGARRFDIESGDYE